MKRQSKKLSVIESIINTFIGLFTSYIVQLIVFPLYGIHISHTTNIQITLLFFVISFARSYLVRRFFNRLYV